MKKARDYMGPEMPITTVNGFPNGNMTTATKVIETNDALANRAAEIDIVIIEAFLIDFDIVLVLTPATMRRLATEDSKKLLML